MIIIKDLIIVYGGSFSPITLGHINIINNTIKKYEKELYKFIVIPVGDVYKKKGLIDGEDRINMIEEVFKDNSLVEISRIEMDYERRLYTLETLEKVKEIYPDKKIWFIIGDDNLPKVKKWFKKEELLTKYKLLVFKREQENVRDYIENDKFLKDFQKSFIIDEKIMKVSSSMVRENLSKGLSISHLVDKKTEKYLYKIFN